MKFIYLPFDFKDIELGLFKVEDKNNIIFFSFTTFQLQGFRPKSSNSNSGYFKVLLGASQFNEDSRAGAYLSILIAKSRKLIVSHWAIFTDGPIFTEVTTYSNKILRQTVKIWKNKDITTEGIHLKNVFDISSLSNTDLVLTINSSINNENQVFYTDVNAFQMQKRKYLKKLPLQGNFYPFTSTVLMEDPNYRLTVLSDQTHGVSCLKQGNFEIVLDRILIQDDKRGMAEPLKDNRISTSSFIILVEKIVSVDVNHSPEKIAFYSPNAHSLNSRYFVSPPTTMVAEVSSNNLTYQTLELFKPLIKDSRLEYVNLRTNHFCKNGYSTNFLVILHMVNYDTKFLVLDPSSPKEFSEKNQIMVKLKNNFNVHSRFNISSLTGLKKGQEISEISVRPGEISSFSIDMTC